MTDHATPSSLASIAADTWEAALEADPLFGTSVGEHRVDGRMADHSPAGLRAARERFASLRRRLDALPVPAGEAVDGPDAITRSALRECLDAQLGVLDSGILEWNVDTLDGTPVYLLNAGDYQPAAEPADRAAAVERWRAMGRFTDDHAANLLRSLRDGRVACSAPVDRVVDILDGVLARPDAAWPLMAPATAAAAGPLSTAERERFAADLEGAIRDHVRPAFERLRAALADGVRPAARPPERPGLCHVPGGDEAYRRLVRLHTSLDATPGELHRIGLAEIERIDAETEALAGRVLGSATRAQAAEALRSDPTLHFTTRDEVLATARHALDRASEAIPAWFGRLPRARCEVVPIGAHEEAHTTVAFYRGPAQDGSRPGQYYVNTGSPATRPRYEAEVLAYHESIPGHHLQVAIAQELDGLPDFRRHLGPTAFIEGWGLYIERLADDMGLYSGDLDRIGVLSFDAWRASRLVVDTGMHALGWTRAQAIEFMLDHTVLAPNNIVNEVDRYIVLPGQALAYKAGQLELLRLRAGAREALGGAFDDRAFHDAVLGNGAIPLETLRSVVGAWVARTAAES